MANNNEYYATDQSRLNTMAGDIAQFWYKIKAARKEYMDLGQKAAEAKVLFPEFIEWLEDTYGVLISMDSASGNYKLEPKIVNEQKYVVFILKYGEE